VEERKAVGLSCCYMYSVGGWVNELLLYIGRYVGGWVGRTKTYQNVIPATHGVLIDRPRVKHHLRVNAGGLARARPIEIPDRPRVK